MIKISQTSTPSNVTYGSLTPDPSVKIEVEYESGTEEQVVNTLDLMADHIKRQIES